MRQICLKLAQKVALAMCVGNDPSEYFNTLGQVLNTIKEGNKPMWTSVYEAYLSLHGAGGQQQIITNTRALITTALTAYKTPIYLEEFEMLILATVLADYQNIICEMDYQCMCNFFADQEARKFESQGITILDEITKSFNNICAYIAHQKLAEIYSTPIFSIIRNPKLAEMHSICARKYAEQTQLPMMTRSNLYS